MVRGGEFAADFEAGDRRFGDFAANLTSAAKGHILRVNVGHRCEPTDHLFSRVGPPYRRRMHRCNDRVGRPGLCFPPARAGRSGEAMLFGVGT